MMRRRPGSLLMGLALATTALLSPDEGRADTKGFLLGLDFFSSHIGAQDPSPDSPPGSVFVDENGGGLHLFVGYGITESFALRLSLAGAEHQTSDSDVDFRFSSFSLDGMYLFRNPHPLRPYLLGGVGAFLIRSRRDFLDFETNGPGLVIGTGIYYFLNSDFALHFGARGDFINWKQQRATLTLSDGTPLTVETPVEEGGSAAKLLLGVSGWF